ncbi:hypothetical protein PSTT_00272 [Puccinia striiformis]|uniref:Uncharacterized protein n=1 Tax=Puccinia striiformis TaxID=27350 RepID=A0A2S4W7F9_9BASI|nr:hypothetical protein PSTT_00272 [Puccinia striiformis]
MAELESSSSLQAAPILEALRDLILRHNQSMPESASVKKEHLTQDERNYKNELLDELHLSLLPAIQDQLSSLSTSLSLLQRASNPNPNFGLTCQILSELDETMYETIYCIESAAIATVPDDTQDHHMGRCKDFRCTHLVLSISDLIDSLRSMFGYCTSFIESWQRSTQYPDIPMYRTATCRARGDLLKNINLCTRLAGNISRWTQVSDFEVLQDEWKEKLESFDSSLVDLVELTQSQISRQYNPTPLREHMVELARWTTLLIKLARMLLTNISNTRSKNLPFTLDAEMNSETLSLLKERPDTMVYLFGCLVITLSDSCARDTLMGGQAAIRDQIQKLTFTFESTLVVLAAHNIALPFEIDPSTLENDFETWLSEWQKSWHTGIRHFLGVLDSF